MPMNPDLLNQLHDIQLPEPIGWWPLAFTWWILIFSVTSILIGVAWYYFDQKRRNAYRKMALTRLDDILNQKELYDHRKIGEINRLLKQVALTAYGRQKTAALYHQAWLDFLFETTSYIPQPDNLHKVLELAYQDQLDSLDLPDSEITASQALDIWQTYARKWIKGHHQ